MRSDWWVGNPGKEASVEAFDDEQRDSASTVAGTTDGKHKASEQKAQKSETKAMSFRMQKHYKISGKSYIPIVFDQIPYSGQWWIRRRGVGVQF